jgi:hypothetical protein
MYVLHTQKYANQSCTDHGISTLNIEHSVFLIQHISTYKIQQQIAGMKLAASCMALKESQARMPQSAMGKGQEVLHMKMNLTPNPHQPCL